MSGIAPKRIPPNVMRELRRHVQPSPSQKEIISKTVVNNQRNNKSRMIWSVGGCIIFTGMAFTLPYFSTKAISNLHQREEPLTAAQVRRGAFMNSGSKDAGRDPNWDFERGQYKKDQSYRELFENDDPNNKNHYGPGGKYYNRGSPKGY